MTASLASSYIGSIAGSFNASRNPKLNAVTVETISWYNPNLITRWNFLPTLMIMLSLVLPMVLLSGMATPVEIMPEALQIITYVDPMRFALNSVHRIYLEGCTLVDVAFNFVPMIILAAITLPLAAWLFRNKTS